MIFGANLSIEATDVINGVQLLKKNYRSFHYFVDFGNYEIYV